MTLFGAAGQNVKDAFGGGGFEIANHSMSHSDSMKLHGSDFDVAIDQAKEIIEKNTGARVTHSVCRYSHDSYSPGAVSRALMGGRKAVPTRTPEFLHPIYHRTVDVVIGGPHVSVETAERLVDIGIKRRLWLIAKCHGVTDEKSMRSFKSMTPDLLEKYLAYIHSRPIRGGGLCLAWTTFSQIFLTICFYVHKQRLKLKNLPKIR